MVDIHEDDFCHLMSKDELEVYAQLSTAEDFELFYEAFSERRLKLNELDLHRLNRLENRPDAIQDVFNRLNLPLNLSLDYF